MAGLAARPPTLSDYVALLPPKPPSQARVPKAHDAAIVTATVGLLVLGIPVHILLVVVTFAVFLFVSMFLIQVVLPLMILGGIALFIAGGIREYTRHRTTESGREFIQARKSIGETTGVAFAARGALTFIAMGAIPLVVVGLLALLVGSPHH
jgi:hypothetical protein